MPLTITPRQPCPCFSGKTYGGCCRPLHRGEPAPSPETLMRSRFSGYALCKASYIASTQREPTDAASVRQFSENTAFVALDILEVLTGDPGFVTFRAGLVQLGEDASFTERSRFEQVDGRWCYVDGERLDG